MDHSEIFGDVVCSHRLSNHCFDDQLTTSSSESNNGFCQPIIKIFQKLDHSSKLHAGLLLSSKTPESLEEWNSGNEPSAQSQLMRCRSVPVIQEAFSLKMPLCPSQSRHRPELLWHRSSFGSNDSVESAIQDDGDDEDEEMIVSPASAEHPVKVSHPPSLLFRSLQPPRLSPSSAPPPFLTHLETSSVFFSLSLDVSLSAPFHSSQPSNQRQPSLEFITSLNVSNTHTGMCYPRVTATHPTST